MHAALLRTAAAHHAAGRLRGAVPLPAGEEAGDRRGQAVMLLAMAEGQCHRSKYDDALASGH